MAAQCLSRTSVAADNVQHCRLYLEAWLAFQVHTEHSNLSSWREVCKRTRTQVIDVHAAQRSDHDPRALAELGTDRPCSTYANRHTLLHRVVDAFDGADQGLSPTAVSGGDPNGRLEQRSRGIVAS